MGTRQAGQRDDDRAGADPSARRRRARRRARGCDSAAGRAVHARARRRGDRRRRRDDWTTGSRARSGARQPGAATWLHADRPPGHRRPRGREPAQLRRRQLGPHRALRSQRRAPLAGVRRAADRGGRGDAVRCGRGRDDPRGQPRSHASRRVRAGRGAGQRGVAGELRQLHGRDGRSRRPHPSRPYTARELGRPRAGGWRTRPHAADDQPAVRHQAYRRAADRPGLTHRRYGRWPLPVA